MHLAWEIAKTAALGATVGLLGYYTAPNPTCEVKYYSKDNVRILLKNRGMGAMYISHLSLEAEGKPVKSWAEALGDISDKSFVIARDRQALLESATNIRSPAVLFPTESTLLVCQLTNKFSDVSYQEFV